MGVRREVMNVTMHARYFLRLTIERIIHLKTSYRFGYSVNMSSGSSALSLFCFTTLVSCNNFDSVGIVTGISSS